MSRNLLRRASLVWRCFSRCVSLTQQQLLVQPFNCLLFFSRCRPLYSVQRKEAQTSLEQVSELFVCVCVCVQACMQHYCNIICVTCVVRHQAGKGQVLAVRASPRCVPLSAPGVHLEWRQRRAKGECDCFPEGIWNKQQGSDFYKTPAVYSATITKYSCWNEDSSSLTKAVITQDAKTCMPPVIWNNYTGHP